MQKISNDRDINGKNMKVDELQQKLIDGEMRVNKYESEVDRLNMVIRDKDDEIQRQKDINSKNGRQIEMLNSGLRNKDIENQEMVSKCGKIEEQLALLSGELERQKRML